MAKKESTLVSMLVTLFFVTAVAGTSLGFIYELTKEPIAKAKLAKKTRAIRDVVPGFDNSPLEDAYKKAVNGDSLVLYPAREGGKLVGTAVETFTNEGFSGEIRLMVGLLPDGTLHSISVLEHKETPGLGDKIEKGKSEFPVQFEGKNPGNFKLEVKKDGGDVDAITASTITSRAYCEAVEKAWKAYMEK
ncbi:MAG: RnfABCDGE type electron transport complex subunit G [Bacteroidota bacterium]